MSFDLTSENNTCEIKEVGKIMTTENDLLAFDRFLSQKIRQSDERIASRE